VNLALRVLQIVEAVEFVIFLKTTHFADAAILMIPVKTAGTLKFVTRSLKINLMEISSAARLLFKHPRVLQRLNVPVGKILSATQVNIAMTF